jgi:hypothetical protein
MIERFAVRIYDPNGVIVPHKEFEIQSGITRFVLGHTKGLLSRVHLGALHFIVGIRVIDMN